MALSWPTEPFITWPVLPFDLTSLTSELCTPEPLGTTFRALGCTILSHWNIPFVWDALSPLLSLLLVFLTSFTQLALMESQPSTTVELLNSQ